MTSLRVLSTLAVMGAMRELTALYEAESGTPIAAEFAPTVALLERLRAIYCSTIAYEVEHITRHEQRSWLRKQIESGAYLPRVSKERRLRLLDRLTRVEAFERSAARS